MWSDRGDNLVLVINLGRGQPKPTGIGVDGFETVNPLGESVTHVAAVSAQNAS